MKTNDPYVTTRYYDASNLALLMLPLFIGFCAAMYAIDLYGRGAL